MNYLYRLTLKGRSINLASGLRVGKKGGGGLGDFRDKVMVKKILCLS